MSSPTPAATTTSHNNPTSSPYPAPFIIEPTTTHTQSWIILHGRGDTVPSFSLGRSGFLQLRLRLPSEPRLTLQQTHPHVRFVFPGAPPRHARLFDIAGLTQWFDVYSWNSGEKSEWQVEGIRETTAWIHEVMRREVESVGAGNVVVGGLSMGGASALVACLLWGVEPIRGVFGMSGWLPFVGVLEGEGGVVCAAVDGFGGVEEDVNGNGNACRQAVGALCQELGMPVVQGDAFLQTPILLTHGTDDGTVDIEVGRRAADCLRSIGSDVMWKEYEGLDHWMRGDELSDIAKWIDTLVAPAEAG